MSGTDDAAGGVMSANSSNNTKNAKKMFIPAIVLHVHCSDIDAHHNEQAETRKIKDS